MATLEWDENETTLYVLEVNEGNVTTLTMSATIITDELGVETFPTIVYALGSWTTPDTTTPINIANGMKYTHPGVTIPALEYSWVIDEVVYTTTDKSTIPGVFDFLTNMTADNTKTKSYDITVNATATGSLGTILTGTQIYTININNSWDGDKAELTELLSRGSL